MEKNVIEEAIAHITYISETLDKYSEQNYNSYASHLIEKMSWDLHKQANDLKEIQYMLGM